MGGSSNLGWNAHRHLASPIGQPMYRFQDVEKCQRSLEGSVVQEITNTREAFKEIMAEMVLLCTEAIKRSRSGRTAGKPLSLEYIADRLDVDDPCFGYVIRSDQGHLQGFITVTTFTNWQKTFGWDSLQEMSFYYDADCEDTPRKEELLRTPLKASEEDSTKKKASPAQTPGSSHKTPRKQRKRKRVIDEDGSLAKELQKTVHLGDPYNEGIVWPRIAEISLLGGLGCGKTLVQLVIEQLEFQRATGTANYDYIALQATDNSIPFYESLGFVRVGAVCYDDNSEGEGNGGDSSPSSPARSIQSNGGESGTAPSGNKLFTPDTIVSSPNFVHEVTRPGESPNDIAKRFKVCVWDIIFLNKDIYPDLRPTSRLVKGTQLYIPKLPDEEDAEDSKGNHTKERNGSTPSAETPTKWFVAKENDTPRKIAKQFGIACNKLVAGNRRRLPELQATSRLRAGTRMKVTNLDQQDAICQPYCHWSFPEDTAVEGGDPSYMMVYKLDRKTARNPRKVRDSLAVPVGKYSPPKLLFPPPPKNENTQKSEVPPVRSPRLRNSPGGRDLRAAKEKTELKFPKQPKRPDELKKAPPADGKVIYWDHQKELHPEFHQLTPEKEKIIRDRWSRLGNHKKERYHGVAAEARKIYKQVEREYKGELARWKKECDRLREEHELEVQRKQAEAAVSREKENSLFNKVIKLKDDALEGKDYKYWFVLTYIPDLKWCHLAPMVKEGHFGPDRKRSYGRPRYRLVDEKLGKELDISSSFCIPVKSKALKRTADADKEEWDILDGPVELVKEDVVTDTTLILSETTASIGSTRKSLSKQPKFRARTPVKPLSGKISIGSTPRHTQDPLSRTRASPASGRKRRLEEIMSAEKALAKTTPVPVRERKRRRCMRCIENNASPSQAVECLGAKGRFGRDACEFFHADGSHRKSIPEEETKLVTHIEPSFDTIEVTLAVPSSPRRPSRRPDASRTATTTSPKRPKWSSPTRSSTATRQKLVADEKKEDGYEHTPRKSRRLN